MVADYRRAAAAEINRFGGHLAKYLGDGVMAFFGYPEAHDNDAERAVPPGSQSWRHWLDSMKRPHIRDWRRASGSTRAARWLARAHVKTPTFSATRRISPRGAVRC
jgi:class 3 adenylate cyclase